MPLRLAAPLAVALTLAPVHPARAYPTSIVFAPSAETLDFGTLAVGPYFGLQHTPQPVDISSVWGGLEIGVGPSVTLASSPAGDIGVGGFETGIDVFGPADDGGVAVVFNFKVQILRETLYLPAISFGLFQISPSLEQSASLGFFTLTKTPVIRGVDLGQLTFGMMTSFGPGSLVAPQCLAPGTPHCLFRGAAPFEDQNLAFIAGYQSPRLGPVGLSIDHMGGTAAVSSTNIMLSVALADVLFLGAGAFFSNDRRGTPAGPVVSDGLFAAATFVYSLPRLFQPKKGPESVPDPPPPRPAARVAP